MYDSEKVILALEKDHVETIIGLLTDRLITAELCKDNAYREVSELRSDRDCLVSDHNQLSRDYVTLQTEYNMLLDRLPAEEVTDDE